MSDRYSGYYRHFRGKLCYVFFVASRNHNQVKLDWIDDIYFEHTEDTKLLRVGIYNSTHYFYEPVHQNNPTDGLMVFYYEAVDGSHWARPFDMFFGNNQYNQKRFKAI